MTLGLGLFTRQDERTKTPIWVVFQAIEAIGQGLTIPTILPAIQASLPESEVATSVGLYSFLRSFGFVWGTIIPGIIFNDQWNRKDDCLVNYPDVREQMRDGRAYHFSTGSYRAQLPETVQRDIHAVYVETLKTMWYAAVAFAAVGFLLVFAEKHIPLRKELETEFGLEPIRRTNREGRGSAVRYTTQDVGGALETSKCKITTRLKCFGLASYPQFDNLLYVTPSLHLLQNPNFHAINSDKVP